MTLIGNLCVYVICMCIFMCVCDMYVYVHIHVCVCECRRWEDNLRCWSSHSSGSETGSLLCCSPLWWQASQPGSSEESPAFASHVTVGTLGLQTCAVLPSFYVCSEDPSSDPHTCMASEVTVQPFPSPLLVILYICEGIQQSHVLEYLLIKYTFPVKTCISCFFVVKC